MNRTDIERAAASNGFKVAEWRDTDDGDTAVMEGSFVVVNDEYEDDGLYSGDEGELSACIVGAPQFFNERISWTFITEGYDEGNEVRDLTVLEPAGD
jgi:hypothetical protein